MKKEQQDVYGIIAGLTLLALAGMPGFASAQEIPLGTWTGGMYPPAPLTSAPATYDVEVLHGELSIKIHQPGGIIPTQDPAYDGNTISFNMSPPDGSRTIECRLTRRDDGSFEGPCVDDSAPPNAPQGRLVMIPPEGP